MTSPHANTPRRPGSHKAPRPNRASLRATAAFTGDHADSAPGAASGRSGGSGGGSHRAVRGNRADRGRGRTRSSGHASVAALVGVAATVTGLVVGSAVMLMTPTPATPGFQASAVLIAAVEATETRAPVVSRSLASRGTASALDDTAGVHRAEEVEERLERQAAREKARRIQAREEAAAQAAAAQAAREAAQRAREEAAAEAAAAEAALAAAAATAPGTLRDMARREMLAFGYAADQWPALDTLVMRESGWRVTAQNPSSGAYGLPQALPGEKMASAGADWRTNPVTQIRWMLGYIKGRYGTPQGALAHSNSVGWY